MVKEHRYLFDVSDITGIVYSCLHCKQEVVCRLDSEYTPGDTCVSCGQRLAPVGPNGINPARTLLTNLRHLLRMQDPTARVQFVVPDSGGGH